MDKVDQLKKEMKKLKEKNLELKEEKEKLRQEINKEKYPFKFDAVINGARKAIQNALDNISKWNFEESINWEQAYVKWNNVIKDDFFSLAFTDLFMFAQEFLHLPYNKENELKLVAYAMQKGSVFFDAMT